MTLTGAKVLVLGAGGAARAAVFGLATRVPRSASSTAPPKPHTSSPARPVPEDIKREAVAKAGFDIIINATPIGMAGTGDKSTATLPLLQPEDLDCKLVFDLVYNPLETPLLRAARQQGIAIITGVEMFVQQGARQFEIWTGKPAPEDEMLRVVLHSLRQAAEAAGETFPVQAPIQRIATSATPPPPPPAPEPPPPPPSAPAKAAAAKPAPAKAAAKKPEPPKPAAKKAAPAPPAKKAPVKKAAVKKAAVKAAHKPLAKTVKPAAKKAAKPAPKPAAKKPAPKAKPKRR